MRRVTGTWHATLVALVVAAMALAACATEPDGPVLTGNYGGQLLGLTATDLGAEWDFVCAHGITGPLQIDHLGAGHAHGTLYYSWGGGRAPLYVTAMPIGDTLIVAVSVEGEAPHTDGYRLVRGAPPDFHGRGCIAAQSRRGTR